MNQQRYNRRPGQGQQNRNRNNRYRNDRDSRDSRDMRRDSRDMRDSRDARQQRPRQQQQPQQQQRRYNNRVRLGPKGQRPQQQMQRQRPQPRGEKRSIVLNTSWTIYIHENFNKDWSLDSYKQVWKINTILDFWTFFNNFRNLGGYQFFLMRGDIKPVYEDAVNKEGGSYSYIIPGQNVFDTTLFVMMKMIGETILDESEDFNNITGMSLVPKRSTSILKVWIKNKEHKVDLKLDNKNLRNCRYQDHKFY